MVIRILTNSVKLDGSTFGLVAGFCGVTFQASTTGYVALASTPILPERFRRMLMSAGEGRRGRPCNHILSSRRRRSGSSQSSNAVRPWSIS